VGGDRGVHAACLPAAIALEVALALTLPAGAAARIVVHPHAGGDRPGLGAAAIERAEPRSIPLVRGAGKAGRHPNDDSGDSSSGSIPGRPPTVRATRAGGGTKKAARQVFASRAVIGPTTYPNSANGKLFGRIRKVGTYSCSASVVRTRNRSVIFTAGHCVKKPGRGHWARQLTFIPAYADGAGPFGHWDWKAVYAPKQWARRGNSNFDYAAIVLRRNHGRLIADTTGALGFAFGVRRNRTYRAVGYPVNKGAGEQMWECVSSYEGPDPFPFGPGPTPIGIGCDMLNGSSGGGWTITRNRVASVSSFYVIGHWDELYGPRFTKRAERIRRRAGHR
jgi:hypothetical protein